jgi:hypothetical protein
VSNFLRCAVFSDRLHFPTLFYFVQCAAIACLETVTPTLFAFDTNRSLALLTAHCAFAFAPAVYSAKCRPHHSIPILVHRLKHGFPNDPALLFSIMQQ